MSSSHTIVFVGEMLVVTQDHDDACARTFDLDKDDLTPLLAYEGRRLFTASMIAAPQIRNHVCEKVSKGAVIGILKKS